MSGRSLFWLLLLTSCAAPPERRIDGWTRRILAVGPAGAGNAVASAAVSELSSEGPEALPEILRALDGAGPAAANWLRLAVDTIGERAVSAGRPLPVAELEGALLDRSRSALARRLAYDWLVKVDATAPDRLIPGMIDDPCTALRRGAVAREISRGEKLLAGGDRAPALAVFKQTLAASRDEDQVGALAKRIEELGEKVNLTKHYGSIQTWKIVGPFDNHEKVGFAAAYPPEMEMRTDAEYDGKVGKVRWVEHTTPDPLGLVDFNKAIGKHMGVVAYAFTEVRSSIERPFEVRAGSGNAIKIWINGQLAFTRDEYHHFMGLDQYRAPAILKAGRNTILIKICQNEEKEEWTQDWNFQARICDPTGGGIEG